MTKEDLKSFFESDHDLIEKWHICAGSGLDYCVEDTWGMIEDLELYKTEYGYFAIERSKPIDGLTGFFIKPEHRNKETILKFWNDVESKITGPYFAGVYNKNEPAMKFLNKRGKILKQNDNETIFYFLRGV